MKKKSLGRMHGLKTRLIGKEKVILHKMGRELLLVTLLKEFTGHWKERDGTIVGGGGTVTTFVERLNPSTFPETGKN